MKKNKNNSSKKKKLSIMLYVIVSVLLMAFTEIIIEPNYLIKSLIKIFIFFGIPFIILKKLKIRILDNFKVNKKDIIKLVKIGIGVFISGVVSYLILRNFFDFSKLTKSLLVDQQVSKSQFILVALYISFGNSLLEEFMFRLISFIKLKDYCDKKTAYLFSAFMFSIYHAAMFVFSFPPIITCISLVGLFILGLLFDYLDDKDNNIYNSWVVHMFADFVIMIVGFISL